MVKVEEVVDCGSEVAADSVNAAGVWELGADY